MSRTLWHRTAAPGNWANHQPATTCAHAHDRVRDETSEEGWGRMVPRAIKRQKKRVCGMRDLHCWFHLNGAITHEKGRDRFCVSASQTRHHCQTRESWGCTRVGLFMPPHLHTLHNVMGICADSPAGFSAQAGVGVLVGWWRAQRDRVDLSTSKLANDESDGAQSLGLPCEIWQTGIRRFIYPLSKYLRKYVTNDIFSGQKN